MKICPKCQKENEDNALFCVDCNTTLEEKNICNYCNSEISKKSIYCPICGGKQSLICSNCKKELEQSFDFCPYCGSSQKPKPPKERNPKVFNLITKICLPVFTAVLLILILFVPVYRFEMNLSFINDSSKLTNCNIYQSGIQVIKNGYIAISEYNIEDAKEEILEVIEEKLIEVKDKEDEITSKDVEMIFNDMNLYKYLLIDNTEKDTNTTLQLQVIFSAGIIICISILLLIVLVFSIIGIFKDKYRFKIEIILLSIAIGLTILLVTTFKLPGIYVTYPATLGIGTILFLIIAFMLLGLLYVYSFINKMIKDNTKQIISKTTGIVIIVVIMFLLSGNLINNKLTNSSTKDFQLQGDIQTQVSSYEVMMEYKDEDSWVASTAELMKNFSLSKKELQKVENIMIVFINEVYVSSMIIGADFSPSYFLVIYILYIVVTILFMIALVFSIYALFKDKINKKGYYTICLSLIVIDVLLIIICLCNAGFNKQMNEYRATGSDLNYFYLKLAPSLIIAMILNIVYMIYKPILRFLKIKKKPKLVNE